MALFSDGPPSIIDDLSQQDSFLISIAGVEGIDVTAKLQLAYNEVEIEVNAIFNREASIYAPVLGQAPLDTTNLSVTPALKLWHTFKSLELFYRDAYFNQLNDRYKAKWAEYQSLSSYARGKFIDTGAGLIIDPLPQPAIPVASFQPSSAVGGTVYFTVTFVNAESQESSPAIVTESVIPDSNLLQLGAPLWPSNATGWNVYVGLTPTSLTLQNTTPLVLGDVWQLILPGTQTGQPPGTGQIPDVTRDLPRRIMRG